MIQCSLNTWTQRALATAGRQAWVMEALVQGFWWLPMLSMTLSHAGRLRTRAKQLVALLLSAALLGSLAGCGPVAAQSSALDTTTCPVQQAAPAPSGYPFVLPAQAPARTIGALVAVAPGQPGFVSSVPLVVTARSLMQAVLPNAGAITIVVREGFSADGGLGGTLAYGVIPASLPAPALPSINVFLSPNKKQEIWRDYCWRVQIAQASLARAHAAADAMATRIMQAHVYRHPGAPDLGSGVVGLATLLNQPGAASYLLVSGNLVSSHGAVLPAGTRLPSGTRVVLLTYTADGDLAGVQARAAAWSATLRTAGASSIRVGDITQWRVLGDLFDQ